MAKIKLGLSSLAQVTLAAAGTAQALSGTSREVSEVLIQADATNTGNIYVGASDVDATHGVHLAPGVSLKVSADNAYEDEDRVFVDLNEIYIDGSNTGDKVNILIMGITQLDY